jgi:hypothetical protein
VHFGLLCGVVEVEAAEAGFDMAVLQKKICVFFPVKGAKGWGGSECVYSGRVMGS